MLYICINILTIYQYIYIYISNLCIGRFVKSLPANKHSVKCSEAKSPSFIWT